MTANENLRALIVKRVRIDGRQVRRVCREVGISPTTVYKWLKRYDENPDMTLADRSRRPRNSPNATTVTLQRQICALRNDMGLSPSQIRLKLLEEHGASPAHSTIHRILHANKPKETILASPSLVPSAAEQLLSILLGATPPGAIPCDLETTTSLNELVRWAQKGSDDEPRQSCYLAWAAKPRK